MLSQPGRRAAARTRSPGFELSPQARGFLEEPRDGLRVASAQGRGQPRELLARGVDRASEGLGVRQGQLQRELAPAACDPGRVQESGARQLPEVRRPPPPRPRGPARRPRRGGGG